MKVDQIKMLICDVDGVMTDGGMYIASDGSEMKRFNCRDGMAVAICRKSGIEFGIISAGHDPALVQARANQLKIKHVSVSKRPKIEVLKEWLEALDLKPEQIAYIGDDLTDMEVMQYVALGACPADAAKQVKAIADLILEKNGGAGCVRELVDEYLVMS